MTPTSRYSRWRAACLLGVHVLIVAHVLHWRLAGRTLAPLELNEVLHTIHLGVVTAGFVFMVGVVAATGLFGRFFCGWGCHLLALQDFSAWLLGRAGVRPRPLRSRVLRWVPWLAAADLFLWPQVERLLRGAPPPALRVVSDPNGWTSFVTTDLWRNLPGPFIAVTTLAVCGGLVVYLLGSRSFCAYACPFGAVFGAAERLAPARIVQVADCSRCGRCTAVCGSHVQVHREVAAFGAVLNPACLRDLDCVSVCPSGALSFGTARPTLMRGWSALRGIPRRYDVTPLEDLLLAVTGLVVLWILRGLYDAVPFLLALAVATVVAFVALLSLRLVRLSTVRWSGSTLKLAGRVTPRGRVFAAAAFALAAFCAHSGFVRYHEVLGQRAFEAVARGASERTSAALARFESVERWGLVRPTPLRRRLASLYLRTGAWGAATGQLRAVIAADPADEYARGMLAKLLGTRSVPEAAYAATERRR